VKVVQDASQSTWGAGAVTVAQDASQSLPASTPYRGKLGRL
jgi:hypothetical protein